MGIFNEHLILIVWTKRKIKVMKTEIIKSIGVILLSYLLFLPLSMGKDLNIYQIEVKKIDGEKLILKSMKGRPMLIVNIATGCGFTPQLEALQKLNQKFGPKGLIILGVPSNDFGGQTPGKNKEVKKFCSDTYGVTFPLTEKMIVKGVKKHALFEFLTKGGSGVWWNFEKFLINKEGKLVNRYRSWTSPLGEGFVEEIEKLL